MTAADHLLHVAPEPGWLRLYLTCIPDVGEHYTLWESVCTCDCDMCTGDDPDHWGCDRQPHDYSLDGAAPCQTKLDAEHCWVHAMDVPIGECLCGEFPEDAAPWPVVVRYLGDGEVEVEYAPTEVYGECDWGGCNRDAVNYRTDPDLGRLPVCAEHRSEAEHSEGDSDAHDR